MAKLQDSIAILLIMFLISTFISLGAAVKPSANGFVLKGKVYCDTCRSGFETSVTNYIEGAKVKLQCKNATTHVLILTMDGTTDASGTYTMDIKDDYSDEVCSVELVSSPQSDCKEMKKDRNSVQVMITENSGMSSNVRYANSLGFLRTQAMPICKKLMVKYKIGNGHH
ncbi:Pollen Ole e 1 allergen and extensin family protein [Zostera marina]|uniref:Pollen Ole e 1 allergen and extensin family protein n=1 Tax=Zostera marina TaxID=29655 RepID=A0A0K9NQI1_ZOSMR|nr:Pollen Ole e 1 allergen and extensin family protein [Zostera marina]